MTLRISRSGWPVPAVPRVAVISLALLATTAMPEPSMAQESAPPQFLENDPLEVKSSAIVEGDPVAQLEILNVSPDQAVTVRLYLTPPLASSLTLSKSTFVIPGGSTVEVVLEGGPEPTVTTGELVVVGGGSSERRVVRVTASAGLFDRPWARRIGGLGLLTAVVFVTVFALTRRNLGHRRPDSAALSRPSGDRRSDEPSEEDLLKRAPFSRALARIPHSASPPVVVGVLGEWGTGKSTVLYQIRSELAADNRISLVWFDPWLHQADDQPVLALLHCTIEQLGLEQRRHLRRRLRVISSTLGATAFRLATRGSFSEVTRSIEKYDKANFNERAEAVRIREHFESLIREALAAKKTELLVIFIDDLDRCDPDKILSLLEALKLYLNLPFCIFYVAVAPEVVRLGVATRYKELHVDERSYLDKVVQLPFELPRLSHSAIEGYVRDLIPSDLAYTKGLLADTLDPNPRAIKRFINVFEVHHTLAGEVLTAAEYEPAVLAALLLLQSYAPETYVRLSTSPSLLQSIADDVETTQPKSSANGEPVASAPPTSEGLTDWGPVVRRVVSHLVRLGVNLEDVSGYVYLTESTGTTGLLGEPGTKSGDYLRLARLVEDAVSTGVAVRFPRADLRECDLSGWNLFEAVLADALIDRADLSHSNLARASLAGASLQQADLSYARLDDADLRGANLGNADLSFASLARCNLRGANLKGARFEGAVIAGTKVDADFILLADPPEIPKTERQRDLLIQTVSPPRWLDEGPPGLIPRVRIVGGQDDGEVQAEDILRLSGNGVLVIGAPGIGKTVLMWYLAKAAQQRAIASPSEPLPIFLSGASWPPDVTLEQWIVQETSSRSGVMPQEISYLLRTGELLLLIDGLDEIRASNTRSFASELGALMAESNLDVVVSSRPAAFESVTLPFKTRVEVAPYTDDRLRLWLTSTGVPEDVVSELAAHRAIWGAMRNPLLARIVSDVIKSGSFVDARDLAASFPKELLRRWARDRILAVMEGRVDSGGLETMTVYRAFQRLAQVSLKEPGLVFAQGNDIVRAALRQVGVRGLDVAEVLDIGTRAGLLTPLGVLDKREGQRFQFSHLAIAEALGELS